MPADNRKKKQCESCSLPTLEYSGGQVIVFNEHSGKKHINKTPIKWIIEQAVKEGLGEILIETIQDFNQKFQQEIQAHID